MPLSKSKKIDVLGILVKPQFSDGSKVKNVFALCIKGLGHWLLNMIVINDSVNNTDECTKA